MLIEPVSTKIVRVGQNDYFRLTLTQKMRKVGSDIVEITKEATKDAVIFTKNTINEVKAKRAAKNNS